MKRSKTLRNGSKRSGTFKSERSNAVERKVENGHGKTIRPKALLR
jgi:hypothetical protein